jgi:DNA-binding response OmpR family regulator
MKTILLVEDDQRLAEACVRILTRAGYSVIRADDGDMALATLQLTPVDLLIVDMFLPGKDGYEVIDACKRIQPSLPIVGMSGGGDVTDAPSLLQGARELGATVTLVKPFAEKELLHVVEHILRAEPKARERWNVLDLIRKPRGK